MASSRSAVEKSGPQHETVLLSFHLTRFFLRRQDFSRAMHTTFVVGV